MKTSKKVTLFTAIFIAIAFTLSCSGDDGEGNSSNSTGGANIFCRTDYTCLSVSAEACFEFGGTMVNSCEGIPPDNSSSGGTQGGSNSSSSSGGTQGGGSSSSSDGGSGCSIQDYRIVTIAEGTIDEQTWMAENLNCDVSGSKCYNDNPANCIRYGRLYDWATAMALPSSCNVSTCASQMQAKHRGICPEGWHIPSDGEWNMLIDYVESECRSAGITPSNISNCVLNKLKANSTLWSSNTGTDDYGFSALPGGYRQSNGIWRSVGNGGYWWSSKENGGSGAMCRRTDFIMNSNDGDPKDVLNSVRCVQD